MEGNMASKYKHFSIAFNQSEYEYADSFFKKFGGFSKFVKLEMKNTGYRQVNDLLEAAYKVKNNSLKEYTDLEDSLSDGL
jgi:hypothetical protein